MPTRFIRLASLCCVAVILRALLVYAAEEDVSQPLANEPPSEAANNLQPDTPSASLTSAELEQAITALKPPFDQQQLSGLFSVLNQIADPQEQARLQRLLDAKVRTMLETLKPVPGTPGSVQPLSEAPEDLRRLQDADKDDLRRRIDTLNFGPTATAEDLRLRDQIVATIAGIQDPILREQFLHQLEERERQGEGETPATSGPSEE